MATRSGPPIPERKLTRDQVRKMMIDAGFGPKSKRENLIQRWWLDGWYDMQWNKPPYSKLYYADVKGEPITASHVRKVIAKDKHQQSVLARSPLPKKEAIKEKKKKTSKASYHGRGLKSRIPDPSHERWMKKRASWVRDELDEIKWNGGHWAIFRKLKKPKY
jgi:hypothetical protein